MAESQGFEPWEPFGSSRFERGALNHSTNSPKSLAEPLGFEPRERLATPDRVQAGCLKPLDHGSVRDMITG